MDVALRLLGPPAVWVDGRWEAFPCAKPEAAFVYLACCGGRVRRATLANLLWPDSDERGAQANLRQTLRTLSIRPWGPYLGRDRFTAWVTIGSDVAAFDRAVEERRWAEAHARYAGPLLEGFALDRSGEFDAWLESERAVIASRWRRATWAWLEEVHADRRWHDVLGACDRLLADDPLDEGSLRWALRAAAEIGDLHGLQRRYRAFREMLEREVGLEPDPATEDLVRGLLGGLRGNPATPGAGASGRFGFEPLVPGVLVDDMLVQPGRPIGRDADIDALAGLVRADAGQVVTLLASGGMGKTTLAAAVVEVLRPAFAGKIAVVALDRIEGPDAVAHAIARATGVALDPAVGFAAQLVAGMNGRRLLLWLDGFESHLDQAGLLADLVVRCPGLRVLVTSRVRLGIAGETVVRVAPLAVAPDDLDAGVPQDWSPAAQLFLQAAARGSGTRIEAHDDHERIEDVCRRLGGHPLAIELVAGWTDVMPLAVLADRLDDVWSLLRSAPPRGARPTDVEGVLWQTWGQLSDEDRVAWARLALMPGTIERGVAAEVGGSWRALKRLIDRAIVGAQDERIGMHALLARFGRDRAEERALTSGAWEAALRVWRERVAVEIDAESGLRVHLHPHDLDQAVGAWGHAIATADWDAVTHMATGLLRALERVGRQRERSACARLASDALGTLTGSAAERAYARVAPFVTEPIERRRASVERAARLARRHDDEQAFALAVAARFRLDAGREAGVDFQRARSAFDRCGDRIGLAALLHDQGERLMLKGFVAEAEASLREAHALYRRLGDRLGEAFALDILTTGSLYRGDVAVAARIVAEARALFEAEGAAYRGTGTLATEAWIAMLTGPAEHVIERTEAFVRSASRFGNADVDVANVRSTAHAVVGDLPEAIRQARIVLDLVGAEDHPEIVIVHAHDRLASALARMGETEAAARHLAAEVRLCRLLDAPRWVAQVVAAGGELALAAERPGDAAALMVRAWHHPGLHELPRRRLLEPLRALGIAPPPPRPPASELDDEALLGRIDALLVQVRGTAAGS